MNEILIQLIKKEDTYNLRLLLESNKNIPMDNSINPLLAAISTKNYHVIKTLLDLANKDHEMFKPVNNKSPVLELIKQENSSLLQILLNKNPKLDIVNNINPLVEAIKIDNYHVTKNILSVCNKKINKEIMLNFKNGNPLIEAIKKDKLYIIQEIIKICPKNHPIFYSKDYINPLKLAIDMDLFSIKKELITNVYNNVNEKINIIKKDINTIEKEINDEINEELKEEAINSIKFFLNWIKEKFKIFKNKYIVDKKTQNNKFVNISNYINGENNLKIKNELIDLINIMKLVTNENIKIELDLLSIDNKILYIDKINKKQILLKKLNSNNKNDSDIELIEKENDLFLNEILSIKEKINQELKQDLQKEIKIEKRLKISN